MLSILIFAVLATEAFAARRSNPASKGRLTHVRRDEGANAPSVQHFEFAQLVDHDDANLGTFPARYWFDNTFWKGPGSPVVFQTPGETDAEILLDTIFNHSMVRLIAERIGASMVILEHRYFGKSFPVDNLTTENMKYLTLENSLKDLTYFARTVELPFVKDASHGSTAVDVPWVIVGGSYSGALVAWTATLFSGTFWAYYASSATIHHLVDFWQYWTPIQENMPQDCRGVATTLIDYIDNILTYGTEQSVTHLKARFGFPAKLCNDDFMDALADAAYSWNQRSFYREVDDGYPRSVFLVWCDYLTSNHTRDSAIAPADAEAALDGYVRWWKELGLSDARQALGCSPDQTDYQCFASSSDNPLKLDTSLSNAYDISFMWQACSWPFEDWVTGSPPGIPTIVSRYITAGYKRKDCDSWFPTGPNGQTYGIAKGLTPDIVNDYTGDWTTVNTSRLIYVNGEADPFREVGESANSRPGGPLKDTPQVPVKIVPRGFHSSDLSIEDGEANKDVKKVQEEVLAQLAEWVGEWPGGSLPQ